MKIAIINNLYYPFNRGGAENVVKEMVKELTSLNHEVFLITTKPRSESKPINQETKTYYLNSKYLCLADFSLPIKLIWHLNNIFFCKNTRLIKKILLSEKPDLVLTHNLMGLGFRLPLIIKKLGIRHEHYLHDIQLLHPSGLLIFGKEKIIHCGAAKIYQFFTRHFFGSPDKVISPSNWLLEQHKNNGFFTKSKTEVKPLVEINKQASALTRSTSCKNNFSNNNFLFVGQIEEHKGIIFLINSFKEALATNPFLNLTIIGDGRLLKTAQSLSANSKQINFLGRLDSLAVSAIMKNSDFLIVPSLCYENAPMTIYEAQANNLSVIAANIGGIPEIIRSQDILFIPGDSEDLKDKILKAAAIN